MSSIDYLVRYIYRPIRGWHVTAEDQYRNNVLGNKRVEETGRTVEMSKRPGTLNHKLNPLHFREKLIPRLFFSAKISMLPSPLVYTCSYYFTTVFKLRLKETSALKETEYLIVSKY